MNLVKKNDIWFPSLFNEFFPENTLDSINYERISIPAVNISENFTNFVLEIAIPGIKKEDVSIEIEKDTLLVSSKTTEKSEAEETTEKGSYSRREFNFSSFKRSFKLPKSINKENVEASFENGVLRIELPKLEEAKNIKRMVEIS